MPRKPTVLQAKQRHEDAIMSIAGVTGVAVGQEGREPCIVVYVKEREPKLLEAIPKEMDGFRVKVEETGEFAALGSE